MIRSAVPSIAAGSLCRGLGVPRLLLLLLLLLLVLLAAPARGDPPPENRCPSVSSPSETVSSDAAPRPLREGMLIGYDQLLRLRDLLPEEIWHNRHVFFYAGMRMEIGSCHRRYPVPGFFSDATEQFSDQVSVDAEGNLQNYVAGIPFPPEKIDLEQPDAGLRWAWNLAFRFRGAGTQAQFRIVDVAGRYGGSRTFLGKYFFLQTRHRADLAQTDFAQPEAKGNLFVAGGRFLEPTEARHLAWRQLRPKETEQRYQISDRTFVYVPTMRKVRRGATAWVDGMYVPRYRVAGDIGGGGMGVGGNEFTGPSGAINPTSALSAHQSEHLPRAFTVYTLRPNAFIWRVRGEREVLAPLNSAWPGFPLVENKNFGPYGLSVASDRWDIRWAVVIEAKPLNPSDFDYQTVLYYVDWQTQQPLYVVTRGSRGRILDVGTLVHRFSDDVMNYPQWENGDRASVFDPVAEVFYRVADDSGWRRESYDARALPPDSKEIRRLTSTDVLIRGR